MNRSRKSAMLLCAVTVVPIVFAANVQNLWAAVGLIGLAAASHQGWSANVYTLASDMFPRRAVASVVGISGFGGAVGGMLVSTFTGLVLQFTGSYVPVFRDGGIGLFAGAARGASTGARAGACGHRVMPLHIKPKEDCRWDLVALGEVMLRLDPGDRRVATTRTFDVCEGGGEYNVARGLKRCFGWTLPSSRHLPIIPWAA